ncbi:transmembrane protein [Beggiatoa sp. PS]|nr:transmembrane protein [Beggiatoa sp. PS]
MFLLLSYGKISYAELPVAQEYQVKAVFLYRFASFVRWPNSVFANRYAPFRICILGDDPFREEIDITVENESIKGRSIEIQRLSNLTIVDSCQILFISQSEQSYLTNILTYIQKKPILTVSDIETFIGQGGMIQFFKVGRRVRFYIAPDTVKTPGLQVSANLLRIAKIVR